jgi:peptidoglycan/LPS O-acetylase OafA/YrhL
VRQVSLGHPKAGYRPDIDGLRAVAVLPVVAFHAGLHLVHGGFVGVDVFFVISGFLITQFTFAEIRNERFSILAFYERRIRRIFPALIAVLFATYCLGLALCLPLELVDFAKSLIAAALSVSNIYFWAGSGYFDGAALTKPLLHTWSLAVEEQFYLFWPVFLIVSHRFVGRRIVPLTFAVSAVSLALSIVGAFRFPNATFYLPFTRIWELAAGGLLALGAAPRILGPTPRNTLSILGLSLIVGSVLLIDSSMPFPGLLAMPACTGAVMLILAGRDGNTAVGNLLSLKPIAFIGTISYSLYLWHWPIVVFQKNYTFLMSGLTEFSDKLLIIGVSIAAATVSWRYVEQPFRTGKRRPSQRLLLTLAGSAVIVLVLLGSLAWSAAGFPSRFSQRELEIARFLDYDAASIYRSNVCFLTGSVMNQRFASECLQMSSTKKNYLLLGDSHAAELWFGLQKNSPDKNFLQATASDCFPTHVHSFGEAPRCKRVLDEIMTGFLPSHRVDGVFLAARWKPGLLGNLAETLDWMRDHRIPVILIGPSSVYDSPVPRLMVTAVRKSDPHLPQRHVDQSTKELDASMSELAKTQGAPYVSLMDLMCDARTCTYQDIDGLPLIFDREHFTAEGSMLVGQKIAHLDGIW